MSDAADPATTRAPIGLARVFALAGGAVLLAAGLALGHASREKAAMPIEVYGDVTEAHTALRDASDREIVLVTGTFTIVYILLLGLIWAAERRIGAQRQSNIALAAASGGKSELLARMSHELRAPLNAILGFSEKIRDEQMGPIGNRGYCDYARDIHDLGTHLSRVIDHVLDLASAETRTLAIQSEPEGDEIHAERRIGHG